MHKVDITNSYIEALEDFTKRVREQRRIANDFSLTYKVYNQSGRKYDKLIERVDTEPDERILYYVERATGTIYGRKNDITPNKFWWFNTIYTASKWDWSDWPKPVSDDTVKLVHVYGKDSPQPMLHYAPKDAPEPEPQKRKRTQQKTPTVKHAPLDMAKVRS